MFNKLQSYIYRLCLPDCSLLTITNNLKQIIELKSSEFPSLKNEIAELFCKSMIVACRQQFISKLDVMLISNAFDSVKELYKEKKENNSVYSYIMNLLFQLQLKSKKPEQIPEFERVADKLEDMSDIFLLKIERKLLFPIGDLLSLVFKRNISFKSIDKTTLNIFLLAMKLFKNRKKFKEQYQKIVEKCNLKCLEYLGNNSYEPIGNNSTWKDNLINNGSLVLINHRAHKIYIRSNSKDYFNNEYNIGIECNALDEPIGYFYEETYEEDYELTSAEEIFESKNLEDIINLLKLLYDDGVYNSFLKNSLLKTETEIKPTNRFAKNDKTIILSYEAEDEKKDLIATRENLTKVLRKYYFVKLLTKNDSLSDFVLIGQICDILNYFPNLTMQDLFLFIKNLEKNYQSEIINYALSKNSYEDDTKFLNHFISETNYIKTPNAILNKRISDFLYFPYQFPVQFLYDQIAVIIQQQCDTLVFVKPEVKINFDNEIQSVIHEGVEKKWKCLDKQNNIQDCYGVLFNDIIYFSNDIDKIACLYEKVSSENKSLYSFATMDFIPKGNVSYIKKQMKLQEEALCDLGKNYLLPIFDTIFYIRLFHHCVAFDLLNLDRWKKFYSIISEHNFLDFSYLKSENWTLDEGILYVPKDKEENDSTLKSVLNKYIFNSAAVRNRTVYYNELEKENNRFTSRRKEIKEIIFLFDNIITGVSTVRCLKTYLNLNKSKEDTYRNIQSYYCENRNMSLVEILEKNNIKFKIRAFYATEIGKTTVKSFIEQECKCFFDSDGLIVDNEINLNPSQEFITNVKEIYGKRFNETDFPVIREYNLPSVHVFPSLAVRKDSIASIFIRKEEVYLQKNN